MIHVQDDISYRIEDNELKGYVGESPFKKPIWNGSEIVEGWTQADEDDLLSETKDLRLKELHAKVNVELAELRGLLEDNQILVTLGRNEKPIPQQAMNWASSVLDQQETIEEEINALTTIDEVLAYQIIIE